MAKLSHKILRQKMLERGLKQESFAEMLGISARHVRNLCYRDIDISVSLCYRMSQVLNTPMEKLLVIPGENSTNVDGQKETSDEGASYRHPMSITQLVVIPARAETGYFVCPRCKVTLEREFVAYCDRCGQRLDWKSYKKAAVIERAGKNLL